MKGSLKIAVLVVIFVATSKTVQGASSAYSGCSIPFNSASDLPLWFPLIYDDNGIVYPEEISNVTSTEEYEWAIRIPRKGEITIGCSGLSASNSLKSYPKKELTFTCTSRGQLLQSTLGPALQLSRMGCKEMVKETISVTDRCYNDYGNIQIGFSTPTREFPLIDLCHDEDSATTLMAQHVIHGGALNSAEVSNRRPGFKSAQFYKDFSVATAYTQTSQLSVFKNLFGSKLANKYIDPSESLYFARGHLAPDGDFVHVYEQNATYYYANVIPQWQAINNGNWKAMEAAIRNYATENKVNLNIWTGGNGILKLQDKNGDLVEIYLGQDYQLPVPEITWKIIEDSSRNASVAIIMQNNPHLESDEDIEILCPDICDQLSWVTWNTTSIEKGFTYCCEVSEVEKFIPYAPTLENDGILN